MYSVGVVPGTTKNQRAPLRALRVLSTFGLRLSNERSQIPAPRPTAADCRVHGVSVSKGRTKNATGCEPENYQKV